VFTARSIQRLAIVSALAGALLVFAIGGVAPARPLDPPSLEPATPWQDLRSPDARDAARTSSDAEPRQDLRGPDAREAARAAETSRAWERYYTRYLEPQPPAPAPSPAPADDTPWLPIALSIAAALAAVGASTVHVRRRRRTARVTA
jgi:hypothetical protein